MSETIAEWFLDERGITTETLRAWGVGVKTDGTVTFPYPNGVKDRPDPTVPLPEDKRRFYFTAGKVPDLYTNVDFASGDYAFLCEGETDTMRLWQELGGQVDVFGIGGINTWHQGLAKQLADYSRVFVILDNDDDYMVKGQVDTAWRKIRSDLGGVAKRVFLPNGVKDVCEFFAQGNDVAVLEMLTKRMTVSRYAPVDFSKPPPPVNWLLDGWIAKGDLTILAGKGGLGKSWITQALTMAVLDGAPTCLAQKVTLPGPGRVLYVDEENPYDVVYNRMAQLGLKTGQHGSDLRYLWNQGIRLDTREAEDLLDEALEYKPDLFVLDSLSRLHSKEENAAGEIGRILNDAVKPLARETGAGVVLIHHHGKDASSPRGSTDIVNAADTVIEVYEYGGGNSGQFLMRLTKSRRRPRGAELVIGITDQPDGSVELVVSPPIVNPIF